MDVGKHVVFARRLSLAIMALSITSLYAGWIDWQRKNTLGIFNQLEQILATRKILDERPWDDGNKVTLASLSMVDAQLFVDTSMFSNICEILDSLKAQGKQNVDSCETPETQRKYLSGLTLKEMELRLPNARHLSLKGLRSEWGADCAAIVFRGREDEAFWIKGIGGTTGLHEVKGSLIYYVRPGVRCRFSPLGKDAPAFFLIDLRVIGGGWHYHAGEHLLENILGTVGYRMFMDSFLFNEDLRKAKGNESPFDKERFFDKLPNAFRTHFTANVPTRFFIVPLTDIESRIIGEAYLKTGILHSVSEIDTALSGVYNVEKISPSVVGIGTNLRLWVSIAPLIFAILSFFF